MKRDYIAPIFLAVLGFIAVTQTALVVLKLIELTR